MKSPFRTWSLRSRLTLGVVLLTAVGFTLASLATRHALENYLVGEVDKQLLTLSETTLPRIAEAGIIRDNEEFEAHGGFGRNEERGGLRTPLSRIPTSTSLTVLDPDGKVIGAIGGDLNSANIGDYLEDYDLEEVAEHKGEAQTIRGESEDFRAVAVPLPNGAGSIVAAQSLGDLNQTVARLGFLFTLIGIFLLLLVAIASRIVVKIGMQPLEILEDRAGDIASGNLSARMPDASRKTEVGRLVSSLNTMLSRIEDSFTARTESENKLRRFVADASHELRTPLTAIRGFSELYRQGAVSGPGEITELIGRIEGESKRMSSLVEDLLLLARLDQAREMESKPVDLVEVVESAIASAKVSGPNHPISFAPHDDELFALGDEERIHQVVANLLANARVHTPAGTEIEVTINRVVDGIQISISDNGPGLSEEDQKKIFERFYRADPSRVRVDGEGSGLGLSIVDMVMKAHGGSVSVVSELGKGATFTLFFPLRSE